MITQYRSAYNNFYKAPTFSGRSSMTVYITSIGEGTYR